MHSSTYVYGCVANPLKVCISEESKNIRSSVCLWDWSFTTYWTEWISGVLLNTKQKVRRKEMPIVSWSVWVALLSGSRFLVWFHLHACCVICRCQQECPTFKTFSSSLLPVCVYIYIFSSDRLDAPQSHFIC